MIGDVSVFVDSKDRARSGSAHMLGTGGVGGGAVIVVFGVVCIGGGVFWVVCIGGGCGGAIAGFRLNLFLWFIRYLLISAARFVFGDGVVVGVE